METGAAGAAGCRAIGTVAAVSTSVVFETLAKGVAGVLIVGRTGFGVSTFLAWERAGIGIVMVAETGVAAGAETGAETGGVTGAVTGALTGAATFGVAGVVTGGVTATGAGF